MTERGPLTTAGMNKKFDTLADALKQKKPWIGLTQGGSSRKYGGARVAARDANIQPRPIGK